MIARGRRTLRRFHIWLGWIVGIPLFIWTASGLFMVAQPIEKVRGEQLLEEAPILSTSAPPVAPQIGPRPVSSLLLEQRADGPIWVIRYADGGSRLADPRTGRLLPSLTASDAVRIVEARYTGGSSVASVDKTAADAPPIDLRREVEAWRVSMEDGTRFYVSVATGEILARRTSLWRIYDFMWGLHILDLDTRENINNPWLVAFSAISFLAVLLALILLPMTLRRRR